MTSAHDNRTTAAQPNLADLMARYLRRQTDAQAAGFAAVAGGDVEAYEAVPVHAVDPREAWDEATAVPAAFGGKAATAGKPAAEWPQLVAGQESHVALPMAAGNYPQLVRDLAPLFHADKLSDLLKSPGPAMTVPGLVEWAEKVVRSGEFPKVLLAVGALRLARQFDAAERLLRDLAGAVPAEWKDAVANEEAALLWQRGDCKEAARRWKALPESTPVLFNRGLAALFLYDRADARAALWKAVQRLPESSGWHHLGRLYLALAES
jgi:hypothetical protein